jgi:hypothetical protein
MECIGIERHGFLGPVTALCWSHCGGFVLYGRGASILAIETNRRIFASFDAFESNRVHGIKSEVEPLISCSDSEPNDRRTLVVVHGEKQVTIARLVNSSSNTSPSKFIRLTDLWGLDDWVLDVQLLKSLDADSPVYQSLNPDSQAPGTAWSLLAIGYAHNFVEIWRWASRERLQVPAAHPTARRLPSKTIPPPVPLSIHTTLALGYHKGGCPPSRRPMRGLGSVESVGQ